MQAGLTKGVQKVADIGRPLDMKTTCSLHLFLASGSSASPRRVRRAPARCSCRGGGAASEPAQIKIRIRSLDVMCVVA